MWVCVSFFIWFRLSSDVSLSGSASFFLGASVLLGSTGVAGRGVSSSALRLLQQSYAFAMQQLVSLVSLLQEVCGERLTIRTLGVLPCRSFASARLWASLCSVSLCVPSVLGDAAISECLSLSRSLSVSLSLSLSLSVFVSLSVSLSVSFSVSISVSLPLSLCLSLCLSLSLSLSQSLSPRRSALPAGSKEERQMKRLVFYYLSVSVSPSDFHGGAPVAPLLSEGRPGAALQEVAAATRPLTVSQLSPDASSTAAAAAPAAAAAAAESPGEDIVDSIAAVKALLRQQLLLQPQRHLSLLQQRATRRSRAVSPRVSRCSLSLTPSVSLSPQSRAMHSTDLSLCLSSNLQQQQQQQQQQLGTISKPGTCGSAAAAAPAAAAAAGSNYCSITEGDTSYISEVSVESLEDTQE